MDDVATANGVDDEPFPEWLRPPHRGFTVDDLFRLTDLPSHTQLVDGALVFRARQSAYHSLANSLLVEGLRRTCPAHLRVRREMIVVLGPGQAPEPDVSVLRAEAVRGLEANRYEARDVVLVVETVAPDSAIRDRERKPQLYARAGIPHFWLVEEGTGRRPVVHVHRLDPGAGAYVLTGVHEGRLTLTEPFGIDIDLTAIDRM
ncbi:Uma2 family endonuclease [Streptomyces sp. S1A]|uniref:Uma2 family endonuclease n=1 Tax=Streptomyces sp. ICN903 TaxID=2964654 RepID=UPI001EDAE8D7|nr:Uma2 family endonuclease [Streptomyces sp. ICN903]MCG3042072.1 Uma2 family endonuclease [Streptomyces sp. ICN903]